MAIATPTSRLSPEDWIMAGFRALAAKGPEGLKAEPLARDLGTTKGSFYWHFKDVPDFHARMIKHWITRAFEDVTEEINREASPTQKLFRLADLASRDDPAHGGADTEPAIRAWARSNPTVANAVAEIDTKRLAFVSDLLTDLGLTNPDFARIIYGAYIGMGTLSANDGKDSTDAMSTLMAAILALQDA